ncbi:hypothetical protein AS593_14215 [Caulobacter vibrioides]|nr:hypothetical protein AS593_14215 [Caulobacter vibrioides]
MVSAFLAAAVLAAQPAAPAPADLAARQCAANAARLVGPAMAKRTPPPPNAPVSDIMNLTPGGPRAAIAGMQRSCADPARRPTIWGIVLNMLSGSVSSQEGLRLAEAVVRIEPSKEAWRSLALARLRNGDDAGALAAWGQVGQSVQPADQALAEIGAELAAGMMLGPERRSALPLAQANERRWRALVDDEGRNLDPDGLIFAIDIEGGLRESLSDAAGAEAAYGRAAQTLRAFQGRLPADRRDALLLGLLTSRVRVLATDGRRDAATMAAQEAAALAPEAMATTPLTPELAAALRAREKAVPASSRLEAMAKDLAKVGASSQAEAFDRAVARIRAAWNAKYDPGT